MAYRDRIKDLRRVRAGDLVADPRNWRRHPEAQQAAVKSLLSRVGYADARIAREDGQGKLILIDGHLRAGIDPNQMVPVLVLDVDEREAGEVLATLDPLAAMAETDGAALKSLMDSLASEPLPIMDIFDHPAPADPHFVVVTPISNPNFASGSGPTQGAIDRSAEDHATTFERHSAAEAQTHVTITCPECASSFSVVPMDLLKVSRT